MELPPAVSPAPATISRTAHAMLVPWGLFARQLGLIPALAKVPIPQRTRDYTPQTKLIEFLVAILSGCSYLQDISQGAHPLDQDQAIARAWGQPGWADYSGVSRTLGCCTTATVSAVRQAVAEVSAPIIDREVVLALRHSDHLIYDGDLTGRAVSATSTSYPNARFGWMDNELQLGYQAALVSLHSPTYGRLWLSVQPHPGDTVSCTQAEALVQAAEARTGVRPLRRTELLRDRIRQQQQQLQTAQQRLRQRQDNYQQADQKFQAAARSWRHWQAEVGQLIAAAEGYSEPRPYSRLAKARHKIAVEWRRLQRRSRDRTHARQLLQRQQQHVQELDQLVAMLERRYHQFLQDNRTNRAPVRAIFRLDGGFGSGDNLALLIEMGYEVYSKLRSDQVTQALRRQVKPGTTWQVVGQNAEIVAWANYTLDCCPYPLDVGLEHFYTGRTERYATLVHYGPEPVTTALRAWFDFYNGRQTIEAGIKEGKLVFQMNHLKVRSAAGLAIQEEFAILAANLVRWAAHWLHEQCPTAPPPFDQAQTSVKQMVRVAANTTALVFWQNEGYLLLKFDELSPFPGLELRLSSARTWQLPLPLFKNDFFGPF